MITGGQDVAPVEKLSADLLSRATASPEQTYVLYDEPKGVTVRALSIVRDAQNSSRVLGYIMVGIVLDEAFLQSVQASSQAELALLWKGTPRAATLGVDSDEVAQFPTSADVDNSANDLISKNIVRTRPGRAMQAVRDRDVAAEVIGVKLGWAKIGAKSKLLD